MTREEILEYFKDINYAYNDCTRYDTLKRMIDELQEPCNDCISRQAVLEKAICVPIARVVTEDKVIYRKIVFVDEIENIPPVTPAEKVGYWRDTGSGQECSECGEIQYGYDSFRKYCANCGAKMGGEQNESDD